MKKPVKQNRLSLKLLVKFAVSYATKKPGILHQLLDFIEFVEKENKPKWNKK